MPLNDSFPLVHDSISKGIDPHCVFSNLVSPQESGCDPFIAHPWGGSPPAILSLAYLQSCVTAGGKRSAGLECQLLCRAGTYAEIYDCGSTTNWKVMGRKQCR